MNNDGWKPRKVVIVGAGAVGSTFAYTLAQSGLAEVSQKGVERILQVNLPPAEQNALARSAAVLRELITQLQLPGAS